MSPLISREIENLKQKTKQHFRTGEGSVARRWTAAWRAAKRDMCEMDTWPTLRFLCFPIRMQDLLRKKSSDLSFRPPPRSLPLTDFAGHRTKCFSPAWSQGKNRPRLYFDQVNCVYSYSEANRVERGHLLAVNSAVDSATRRKSIWQERERAGSPIFSRRGMSVWHCFTNTGHIYYTLQVKHIFFRPRGSRWR